MQETVGWPDETDPPEPVARVLIDDHEVEVHELSVTSEIDSAMPDRVAVGGGGVVAATGMTTFVPPQHLLRTVGNPWGDASRYVTADTVAIDAGYRDYVSGQTHSVRQLTGQVDSLEGGPLVDGISLEFVDHAPLLDRDITIEPLLDRYPRVEGAPLIRGAGLSPMYITDRVLRHCGFYATPPTIPNAVVSAPLMGSAVPERGTLYTATAATHVTSSAAFSPTGWGMGLGNGHLTYQPDYGALGHARLTSTLHVSFHRQAIIPGIAGNARIDLRWGSSDDAIRINAMGDGSVVVRYRDGGESIDIVALSAFDAGHAERFTVLIDPAGEATIHAANGVVRTGSQPLPSLMTSQSMNEVFVRVPSTGPPVGGLQVAFVNGVVAFERNAFLDPPAYAPSLAAFPFQHNVNCLDLLKEQSQAELAAMWIDEHGNFRWRNRHRLRDAAPVGTLTSRRDLLDLGWQVPVRSVFSRVELEHQIPTITIRATPSITVSEARGSTLTNGEQEYRFFEPAADQDWHEVAFPAWVGNPDSFSYWDLRRGRGSYRGGVLLHEEEDGGGIAYSSHLVSHWRQINPQRWLLESTAQNLAEDEYIEQRLLERPDLYGRFAGENLPLIRAKGLVEWEATTTTGSARGPEFAPKYTHQVGPWIQDSTELAALADWLADYLTKPDIILRQIPIYPDPRIQLGDVFWLEDTTEYHVRLKILVLGKTLRYQNSGAVFDMTQHINCRVIDMEHLDPNDTEGDI